MTDGRLSRSYLCHGLSERRRSARPIRGATALPLILLPEDPGTLLFFESPPVERMSRYGKVAAFRLGC